jgi:hypothetical protein
MGSKINLGNGSSVVAFLREQHEDIKRLFATMIISTGNERERAFNELRRLIYVHETAEEQVVHPAALHALKAGGRAIVEERLREENEGKRALAELATLDLSSAEFETKARELQAAVLAHAESEETKEFAKLEQALDSNELLRLKASVIGAEAAAPMHPHPGVESALVNKVGGRTRDSVTHKHSAR